MSNYVQLMLDSGSYAAWRERNPIDINDYIKFIGDHERLLWGYVSLDAIPGSNGRTNRSPSIIEQAAYLSHKNHKAMRAAGLRPIPVYHQGEDVKWLDTMLDEGEMCIGLAPDLYARPDDIIRWLDVCYSRLCDKQGYPLVKTHGFKVAISHKLLKRYPFFSADEYSWALAEANDPISIPIIVDGKIDYAQKPLLVKIIDHDARGPVEQEIITKYLTKIVGASMTEVLNESTIRQLSYINNLMNLAKSCHNVRFKNRLRDLISTRRAVPEKTTLEPWTLNIVFATTIANTKQNKILTSQDARCRLLSYYALKDDKFLLEQYVKTGLSEEIK